jgi:hypothetical protein
MVIGIYFLKCFSLDEKFMYYFIFRLLECADLSVKNGACDPYATITLLFSNSRRESRKSRIKKKTTSPIFDETFIFEVGFVTERTYGNVKPQVVVGKRIVLIFLVYFVIYSCLSMIVMKEEGLCVQGQLLRPSYIDSGTVLLRLLNSAWLFGMTLQAPQRLPFWGKCGYHFLDSYLRLLNIAHGRTIAFFLLIQLVIQVT